MFGNGRIKSELSSSLKEIEYLKKQLEYEKNISVQFIAYKEELEKVKKELTTVKKQLREQTEADILVNAFKAVGIIKEEKKGDYFHQHYLLQSRLNGVSNNGWYGGANALGLSSLLGY